MTDQELRDLVANIAVAQTSGAFRKFSTKLFEWSKIGI